MRDFTKALSMAFWNNLLLLWYGESEYLGIYKSKYEFTSAVACLLEDIMLNSELSMLCYTKIARNAHKMAVHLLMYEAWQCWMNEATIWNRHTLNSLLWESSIHNCTERFVNKGPGWFCCNQWRSTVQSQSCKVVKKLKNMPTQPGRLELCSKHSIPVRLCGILESIQLSFPLTWKHFYLLIQKID